MDRVNILGAGVIGLYTGYILLKRGYQVSIYDPAPILGLGASGRNAGVLHIIQRPFNSLKSLLALEGAKLHRILSGEVGYEILDKRLYILARNSVEKIYLNMIAMLLHRRGYSVEKVYRDRLEDKEFLSKDIQLGIRIEGYGVVEPMEMLHSLYKALQEEGGEVKLSMEADPAELDGYIVIAAGHRSYELGASLGDQPPRHRLSLGVMLETNIPLENMYTVPPTPIHRHTKGGAIIPRKECTVVGPGFRWVDDTSQKPRDEDVESIKRRFQPLLSREITVEKVVHGFRTINLPHDDFIIRRRGRHILLYGIDSPGLTAAPAIGYLVAWLIKADDNNISISRDIAKKIITRADTHIS